MEPSTAAAERLQIIRTVMERPRFGIAAQTTQPAERVFRVRTAANLRAEWLTCAEVAGITAGASTPDNIIDDSEDQARALGSSEAAG